MKNLIVAIVLLVVCTGLIYASTGNTERKILNGFAEASMGVPEWVKVDWTNDTHSQTSHQITYGLGGRTCHSIVRFEPNQIMTEAARKCYN